MPVIVVAVLLLAGCNAQGGSETKMELAPPRDSGQGEKAEPLYGLPLEIEIQTPPVPEEIQGPSPPIPPDTPMPGGPLEGLFKGIQ